MSSAKKVASNCGVFASTIKGHRHVLKIDSQNGAQLKAWWNAFDLSIPGTHGKEFEGERKHYTQNQMPAACLRNILVHNLPSSANGYLLSRAHGFGLLG